MVNVTCNIVPGLLSLTVKWEHLFYKEPKHDIVISYWTVRLSRYLNTTVIMVSDAFFNIIMLTLGRYL